MKTDVSTIVDMALVALDETPASPGLECAAPSLESILRMTVEEAAVCVLLAAPPALLSGLLACGNTVAWHGDASGHIVLPGDFLRLIEFRMSDWKRSVFSPVKTGSDIHMLQQKGQSPWRGNPDFPVCALSRKEMGMVLEFWSCADELARVDRFLYLQRPAVNDDGIIDIPELCLRPVVYEAARRAAMLHGDTDRAGILDETVKSLYLNI